MQTFLSKLKLSYLKSRTNHWSFSYGEEEREELGITYRDIDNYSFNESYSEIEFVSFLVYEEVDEIDVISNFLMNLPKLEVLKIPIDWLCILNIPIKVRALLLLNSIQLKNQYFWCTDLLLSDLKYLSIPELVESFNIDFNNTPNLEWIEIDLKVEKKQTKIIELSKIKSLKHLSFKQAKSFDVFTPFSEHKIKTLELFACKGKKFPIEKITMLNDIEYLRINNISVDFDCSWLLELPNLIEVELLNIKRVLNIVDLLKIDTLKSLSILNCNNPFGDNKEAFNIKNFDLLRIENA